MSLVYISKEHLCLHEAMTTTETDSGPAEQVSTGKKVYLMRKCWSRIIIVYMSLFIEYFKIVSKVSAS